MKKKFIQYWWKKKNYVFSYQGVTFFLNLV